MRKSFSARNGGIFTISLFLTLFLNSNLINAQCPSGVLSGIAYLDANNNGINESGESLHSGLLVRAYDASGTWIAQDVTDASGQFTITGLTDDNAYRLEYSLGNNFQVSNLGTDNGGDIQFATAPFCDAGIGLSSSGGTCGSTTEVYLSCFVNGLGTNSPGQETLIGMVNSFNASSQVNVYATQAETGAVWGMAYRESTQSLFSSAFVKQHSSLGPGGIDAIYNTSINGTPSTSVFAKLGALGQNVGSLSASNSASCAYGLQVGKVGLGGLTIDDAGAALYVSNLFNNTIVKIDATNPTPASTTAYQVPNPGCSTNDNRIFGVEYHNGSVYVGVTCTGENSSNENDTSIHVYEMNTSSGAFSLVFSDTYSYGYWSDNNIAAKQTMQWLTDIAFDSNNNMILALSDRIGHSYCDGGSSRIDDQFGDILLATPSNGGWILESNGSAGSYTGTGVGNNQGPGGGEFFGEDFFPANPSNHPEIALGSVYVLPGNNEVVASVFDPAFSAYSGGLHRYSTTSGQKVGVRELYNQNIANYFGKATGFGDIVGGCGTISPQIGNYVWIDSDCDGVQDAGESAMSNTNVSLYDSQCNLIGTTTTDTNGNYSFSSGVNAGSTYYVALDPSAFDSALGAYDFNNILYSPTVMSAGSNTGSDVSFMHNCSALGGIPAISVVPSGNNTTFDIGLKPATDFDLALMKINLTPNNNRYKDIIDFEIRVYNQGSVAATNYEIVDYISPAYHFDASLNPGWVYNNGMAKLMINNPLLPGQDHKEKIRLKLVGSRNLDDLVNHAEISYTMDSNGNQDSDIDSTSDDDATNDIGGVVASNTDDLITDVGIIDEDDEDPAMVYIFDLALSKVNRDNRTYDAGEIVTFDIEVTNQGNVDASSFEIADIYPAGLIFNQSNNQGWTQVNPQLLKYQYNQVLAAGASVTVPVSFTIGNTNTQKDLMNYAEISGFVSADPSITQDFDSYPDTDMFNDVGGVPYTSTDGMILDHAIVDEDDHDPAGVSIRAIDLALIKKVSQTSYQLGSSVIFDIEVHNQGTAAIGKIQIVDFLPANMTLVDNAWTLDASGAMAYKDVTFLSPLLPGKVYTDQIELQINANGPTGAYLNYAEISKVYDVQNNDISGNDIDSSPDAIMGNDAGGMPVSAMDDYLDGTGLDDEDDSDPAMIFVPTIEFSEECYCLNNASDSHNGQFRNEIKITSVSGEDWFIDFEYEFYDIASAVGSPVSYATGPTGKQFIERPNGDGTSCYILRGKSIDAQPFTLRATNGWGVYLSIEGGDCDYCSPLVEGDGLGAVCANSTHTYTVDTSDPKYDDCVGFSWFLSGGAGAGTIVNVPGTNATGSGTGMTGSGTGASNSITIEWGTGAGPHDLVLIPHCPNDCVAPVSLSVQVGMDDEAMSCQHELNISLDNGCKSTLYPEDILTSDMSASVAYQLILTDAYGNVIQGNNVTEEHLWTKLMAKVMNPCSGNSCWAFINVEDKLPPQIQCDDIEVKCYQMHNYEPLVIDNCSTAEYIQTGETTTPLPCGADYIKEIYRTYVAEDGFGNVSQPCTQKINVLPIDLDEIEIPIDYTIIDDNALSCDGLILNEEGNPDIAMTGVPTIGGNPIYPVNDLYCNIGVDYRDVVIIDFGCSKKLMRTWTVYDGCADPLRRVQTIEISDNRPPWVDCPANVTINTDGTVGCDSEYVIPLPEITDDCTVDNFIIDVNYSGGFIQNYTTQSVTLTAAADNLITYNVYDQCGNNSTCDYRVTVMDNVSPTAICDQNSVVSLRLNGTAKAFPQTFDDGSYDDCDLFKTLVRRMDSPCECDRPKYDDMHFLGERNGRYYYLSSFERPCFKAFAYASAYGGSLVTLESEGEHDWIYEQVSEYLPGVPYYIGLKDKSGNGDFTWNNHAAPSFNKWEGGNPAGNGECVVVNADGEWNDVSDFRARFVMEVSNPCAFSSEVSFCCADVGQESMVVLRAIDYFGNVNDCMVNIEVQDKVPPVVACPDNVVLDCSNQIDLNNLETYGTATASDSCVVNLNTEIIDERNQCGLGRIIRRFTAEDASGASSCDQVILFENNDPFDFDAIVKPLDFDTDLGCNFGTLHPDNLPAENAYPTYLVDACDLVDATFEDQVFSFAGPGSDACLKILRKWSVIDWCQNDADGLPMTVVFDQTIKVINTDGPVIDEASCAELRVSSQECENGEVTFSVVAHDDCTPDAQLQNCLRIDLDSDGTFDIEDCLVSNVVAFNNKLPLGHHTALISFSDLCGNVSTCSKEIWVVNEKAPLAYCKSGLSVALEPMDLVGNDGIPDDEMACIFPHMLDVNSSHPCGNEISLSFCDNDPTDMICFDCTDIGSQIVYLCVTDEFGNSASCQTTIEVQDNNDGDFCPEFDLALIKQIDFTNNSGPFSPGDNVEFRIIVLNQGNQDAYNISIADYVPVGFTLNDSDWTMSGGIATLNNLIGFIPAGGSASEFITLTIDNNFMGDCIINFAEITGADDDNDPSTPGRADLDSTPDSDQTNDIVGGDNILDNSNNDEDDHDLTKVDVVQIYDLALSKGISSTTPGPFMPGDAVCYDITVTNEGTLDATTVYVSDNIPAGLILNDNNWTVSGGAAVLTNPIAFIGVGNSATVKITFEIDEMFMGNSILNDAQIIDPDNSDRADIDSNTSTDKNVDEDGDGDGDDDDEDWAMIAIGQSFDLALTKVVSSAGPYLLGDVVVFDITVINQGSLDATNVAVTDYVPAGFTYVSSGFNSSAGWSAGPNPTNVIGNVPVSSSATVQVELVVDPSFTGTSLVNDAEITAADNALNLADDDSTPGDNQGTPSELASDNDVNDAPDNPNDNDDYDPAEIIVDRYDLALEKNISTTTPGPYMQGSTVTYDIVVTNQGSLDATTVYVEDDIPVGLNLVDSNWSIISGAARINSPIAFIPAGGSSTVTITFEIDMAFMGTSILNDAQIIDPDGSDLFDIDSNTATDKNVDEDGDGDGDDDDEDWAMITVGQNFDLALTKMLAPGGPAMYQPGDIVTFSITVVNQGSLDATDVEVTDYVPANLIYTQSTFNTNVGWGAGPNPSLNFGNLPFGNSATRQIQLQIDPNFTGAMIINDAEITSANNALGVPDEDSSPGDNSNTPSETGTDNDIDDAPDNPNDSDDYDPAEVMVECNLEPICSVINEITLLVNANGQATLTADQIDSGSQARCDGLDITFDLSQTTFTCANKLTTNIVDVVVTDAQGNVSNNPACQTRVLIVDEIDPVLSCIGGVTTTLNASGEPIIDVDDVIISATDNCDIVSTELTVPQVTDVCDTYLATIVVTDICGNTTNCNFEVSIADQPPVARCKDPFDLCLDDNGIATLLAADIDNGSSDDCGIEAMAIDPMSFDCDDVGPKVVMLSVMDNNANPQTDQCTTVVTIIDKTPPAAICQSITVEVGAAGTVSIASAQIDNGSNDACGLANNPFSLSENTFNCANKGISNAVTLTVTDVNGNTSSCNANVNVLDTTDPILSCRTARFLDLDEDGEGTITSNFIVTGSSDNCPGHTVGIDREFFTCVDKAEVVVVTATATDNSGNTATCTTNVTVRDRIDPTCTLLSGQVFNVVGNPPVVTVEIDDVLDTYTDNCAIAPTNSSISPNNFTCMDLGLKTITLTVDDGCGNTSTCSTQITIQDVSVPTCNVVPDITLDLEPNGMLNLTADDINISSTAGCDPNATLEVSPNFFGCNSIPLNPHCVILTVTSSNGNSATCKSNVSVQDVTPPTVTCLNNFNLNLDASGNASLAPADIIISANDECDPVIQTIDITSFDCDDKPGPVVVTATVTDDNGNSTTCTTNVTIEDDFAPTCTLQSGLSFDLIGTPPTVTLTVGDVLDVYTDNCGTAPASSSITPATFDCSEVGPQTVTVTVTDDCGNSSTCTTSVNIADTSDPTCITQDVTVCLDDTGNGTITADQVDNGSNAGCGTNVNLSVTPTDFDCGDIGANTVVLTVTTTGGNSSTCTATVTVEDKIAPVITCPADVTVECGNSMLSNISLFGEATATDNCPANLTAPVESLLTELGNCGLGTFTRTFTISDGINSVTCAQVITVDQLPPFVEGDITCPMSEVTLDGCIDLGDIYAGSPIITPPNIPCVSIVVDSTFQDVSPQTTGTCIDTFLKTWTILDECTTNSFTCEQTIILNDGEGPMITCTDVVAYIPQNATVCSLFVDLPVMISDPCTMNPTGSNDSEFADNMNIANAAGTYPGGETTVMVSADDNCGNISTCEYTVTVLDTFASILSCSKILESIQPSQTGLVTIDQALAEIDSNCPDDSFLVSFSNTDNMTTSFIVDCADAANAGGIVPGGYWVYLWSGTTLLDSCNNELQVLDPAGHCNSPVIDDIVGRIYTEDDEMLPEVMVNLEGSNMDGYMTDEEGYYAFESVETGDSYMILPEKDKDYLNGVSTLDLIIIQRHVLGLEPLDSPYKIIAADINRSDEVNGLDLVELRKLILGLYDELPSNTSWRIVDAGHTFIDPTNPFLAGIPENYIIYDFQDQMEVDFIGVKVGDVNGTVIPAFDGETLDKRSGEKVRLSVPEVTNSKGSVSELKFSMYEIEKLQGFQYTIELDPKSVEILEFIPLVDDLTIANVNMNRAAEGIISFSWNANFASLENFYSADIFGLQLKYKDDVATSDYLTISETGLRPEAYLDDEVQAVELEFIEEYVSDRFTVYQNSPNPWSMSTEIVYYLPSAENVLFNVYNVEGELVSSTREDGIKGNNTIILDKEDLSSGGIYYYEIISSQSSVTQKMILIK